MDQAPWPVLVAVWRNTLLAFVRLPLLILGCFLLYVLLSGFWLHDMPFHLTRGYAAQVGYDVLHGVAFAPLVLGVMLMISGPEVRHADVWSGAAVSVGLVILIHGIASLVFRVLLALFVPKFGALVGTMISRGHLTMTEAAFVYAVPLSLLRLSIYLLFIRLILLLPVQGLERLGWRAAFSKAWQQMKGHYGFSLAVTIAALLPLLVAEYGLNELYRHLEVPVGFAGLLARQQWEALMAQSAALTLEWIVTAALAAGLYLAIRARTEAGPLLSDASLAHRPAQ
jgi:hypothetical protein